jgi:dTDP-4-dehydrorhamnose reductase
MKAHSVLVTGATGLLGSHLVAALDDREDVVFVGHANVPPGDRRFVACDLTDAVAVAGLVRDHAPRLVVNCAALTNVDTCESQPGLAEAINTVAPARLAALGVATGFRLVQISTDSVFDGTDGPYAEADATAPLNEYAGSKLAGERGVAAAGGDHLILRTTFFGRSPTGSGLADWLIRELGAGRSVTGFEDVRFSPLDAATLVGCVLELAASRVQGTLHLGASDAVSKLAFALLVASEYGFDPGLVRAGRLADAKLDAPRPLDTALDTRAAAAALGRALPTVGECVARMLAADAAAGQSK